MHTIFDHTSPKRCEGTQVTRCVRCAFQWPCYVNHILTHATASWEEQLCESCLPIVLAKRDELITAGFSPASASRYALHYTRRR